MSTTILARKKYDLEPLGLAVNGKLTFAEWAGLGAWLEAVDKGLQWCIGDWLVYGEDAFGEDAAQAVDATGWAIATISQYRWVCSRVPRSVRRPELSFFHHREVADLPIDEQREWLQKAVDGEDGCAWTTDRLRTELKSAKTGAPPTFYVVVSAKDREDADALLDRMRGEGRTAKLQTKTKKTHDDEEG